MPLPILGKASVARNVSAAQASSRAHPNENTFIILWFNQILFSLYRAFVQCQRFTGQKSQDENSLIKSSQLGCVFVQVAL